MVHCIVEYIQTHNNICSYYTHTNMHTYIHVTVDIKKKDGTLDNKKMTFCLL